MGSILYRIIKILLLQKVEKSQNKFEVAVEIGRKNEIVLSKIDRE